MLKGKSEAELRDFINEQLQLREPYYRQAQHIIDVNVLDSFDKISIVVDDIQSKIISSDNYAKMEN